jgi:HD-GYP domain-containing protein (c-di-GMP phosphodiesterase class II)
MRIVPVELAEDLYSSENVYDASGRLLLKAGASLPRRMLDLLRENGIFSLYVNDSYSMNVLIPPISTDLKLEMNREMLHLYEIIRLRFEAGKEVEESTLRPLWKVMELAEHIQYELLQTPRQYIGYTDIKTLDGYTVSHSLNVAVLALLLGLDLGLNKIQQRDLFLGSLFHDIGMNYVNERIIMKNGKLNMEEFMKIKEHPQIGHELFKGFSFATAHMRNIILTHHEKLDGSGYPNGLKALKIQKMAQMVAVVDGFDAMTSDRAYSRAVSPYEAMRHMSAGAGKHLDAEILELFFKKVQPYPEGSIVRLSNDTTALVVVVDSADPLRPTVLPISQKTKKLTTRPFSLAENPDVQIRDIVYDILLV